MSSAVHRYSFFSHHLQREKNFWIYLPPTYHYRGDLHYSTLYTLPGLMDYEATWCEKGRLHEAMDNLIFSNKMGEMIVVMPDKDDTAVNPAGASAFAHYVIDDLRSHVERSFRAIPVMEHRGLEGLSLGATWSIRLAANFPGIYSSVGVLSTQFDEGCYQTLAENHKELQACRTRFILSAGTGESDIIPANQHMTRYLQSLGLEAHFFVEEGPHDWPLWQRVIYRSLPFHYWSFNR